MIKKGDQEHWEELVRSTVGSLFQGIELRCAYIAQHSRRTANYALLLAEELKISTWEKSQLQIGALLHDLGVIGIGNNVLYKVGSLTPKETEIMKTHPIIGAKILEQIPYFANIVPLVKSHHERWTGDGYPDGLKGDQIPYLSRIIAVAEAFDAMTFDRPYRDKINFEAAFVEVAEQREKQFDPDVARAFCNLKLRIKK